ncbi:WxL protein peptidoglycan domain-containing protein [Rugosimonospora africana]|uniref:DUF916 domain-containing protein n=1 Tax=Rugosimonospora africana TaxID=556532 RepID=A0A8J3VVK5_9ACTN|nr:DUF916 domain-containing protein [Rugosimonospora africana]GIH20380.1 hypothetical protein Raf01_85520 [Rugosimonospora africana]
MTSPGKLRGRPRALLACAAATMAALLASATPAVAAPTPTPSPSSSAITWGVLPSTAKGPDGRSRFDYQLGPAKVVHDYVGVANFGATAATFHVYASDAVNTPSGGFDLLPGDKTPTDIGAWVTLAQSTVTVPPHARANVPFTLTIPANATPGDHVGGIVAAVQLPGQQGSVRLERRVGSRIYLRIPGNLVPSLAVTGLHSSYHGTLNPLRGGAVRVDYTVRNTGNIRLSSRQLVDVTSMFGTTMDSATPPTLPELLPGQSYHAALTLRGAPFGPVGVTAKMTPGAVTGDTYTASLTAAALGTAHRSATIWAVPWPQLAVLVLLAAAIWLVVRLVARRRRMVRRLLVAAVDRGRLEGRTATVAVEEPR